MASSIISVMPLRATKLPEEPDDEKKKEIEAQDSEDGPDDIQEPKVITYE